MRRASPLLFPCTVALLGCAGCVFIVKGDAEWTPASKATAASQAEARISEGGLLAHIRTLASDDFEGRGPGTPGEDKSVEYLVARVKELGLVPGNPDGTYVQRVPLVGFTAQPEGSFRTKDKTLELAFPEDAVALTRRFVGAVDVQDSEVVFVGYGVVAPEFGWDDYKGVDVRGKTIVMLVGDPPVPDPTDPTKLDESSFGGRAMTYYGRWTYKYEIAAEKGAAAVLIVHQTGPAGYGWQVVEQSFGRENFDIDTPDGNAGRAGIEGWITADTARALCSTCGKEFAELEKSAASREFAPVSLGATASFHVKSAQRRVESRNVVALLPGSDLERRDELVVYTAHWDHLGRKDVPAGQDGIFNGAVDNASGSAGVLEIARAFRGLGTAPRRSILFLFVTAEEKGLLGSKWYAAHPLYPLARTVCDVNMDSLNVWGRTSDVVSVGYGQSTLDEILVTAAARQGRSVAPDPTPEKGSYFRSDHFEFAKVGVPALYADGGVETIGQPPGFGRAKQDEYVAHDYHQPSDEVKSEWDLSGAVQDLRLLFRVGLAVANAEQRPEWKDGSPFKSRRAPAAALSGTP